MKRYGGLVLAALVFAFLGLAVSVYLVDARLSGEELACSILSGCNAVAASPYSMLFGISLSSLGLAFYFVLFVLAAGMFIVRSPVFSWIFFGFASAGLLSSVYFVSLQFFIIRAQCIYCMISAVLSLLLFIVAVDIARNTKAKNIYTGLIPPLKRP